MSSAKFKAPWLRRDQHLKPVSWPGGLEAPRGDGRVSVLALSWGQALGNCLITPCLITNAHIQQLSSTAGSRGVQLARCADARGADV